MLAAGNTSMLEHPFGRDDTPSLPEEWKAGCRLCCVCVWVGGWEIEGDSLWDSGKVGKRVCLWTLSVCQCRCPCQHHQCQRQCLFSFCVRGGGGCVYLAIVVQLVMCDVCSSCSFLIHLPTHIYYVLFVHHRANIYIYIYIYIYT